MLPRASSTPPVRTNGPWRRVVLQGLPVGYVGVAAFRSGEHGPSVVLAILVALGVAVVGALRPPKSATPAVGRAHAWITTSLAVSIATAGFGGHPTWAALVREAFALVAALLAVSAMFRIEPDAGLAAEATAAENARRPTLVDVERFSLAATIVAAGQALLVDGLVLFGHDDSLRAMAPVTSAVGAASTLFVLGATALVVTGMRRLELGAPPRALACAACAGIGLLVAAAFAFATTMRADAAATLGVTLAAGGIVAVAAKTDAFAVARRGRRVLTLALFGGPAVTLAATAAGHGSGGTVLVFALAALVIGAVAANLEEPLLPVKGALLRALDDAQSKIHDRDARAAIAHALIKLREASGHVPTADHPGASAELWMLHPTRVCSVDAAGYLHERPGELPKALFDVTKDEPHQTLRIDVLRALEVRRPDLRGLLRWLDGRGAISATLVAGDEEPDGVLLVPQGTRGEPLSLEEVAGTKRLADAFVSICQTESAHQRHLARERALTDRVEALDDRVANLAHAMTLEAGRSELSTARLARPASVGIYSVASRLAYDALARRIERDAPVVVLARTGIDPVPFLARAHLGGPRKDKPLVIVDGTSSREHDVARWKDASLSPLALADGGRLVLVDGAALPPDVQRLVARALVERRPPWERPTRLDVAVALTSTTPLEPLVAEHRLVPELAAHFEDGQAIALPRLSERAEDLFSIIADRLAREGLRVHGRPIGIDAAAFARFVEHPFEGEEAELSAIVTRLVANVSGDVVHASDIDALEMTRSSSRRRHG